MFPYYIPVILTTFFLFCQRSVIVKTYRCKKKWNVSFFLGVCLLIIFAAIRGNGDGDYFAYRNYGAAIKTFHDIFCNTIHLDTGYAFLAWIVNLLHLPAQTVIAMMALISLGCIAITIKRFGVFQK